MKKVSLVAAIVSGFILTGCEAFRSSPAWNIAMHTRAPGRGDATASDPYARDLEKELKAHGIEARRVTFHYTVKQTESGNALTQSAVIYRNDRTPRYPWWMMDNMLSRPIWLPNGTLEQQLRYAKHDRSIELVVGSPEPVGPASASESPARASEDKWEETFRRVHGTTYDPASVEDREKMAALKKR